LLRRAHGCAGDPAGPVVGTGSTDLRLPAHRYRPAGAGLWSGQEPHGLGRDQRVGHSRHHPGPVLDRDRLQLAGACRGLRHHPALLGDMVTKMGVPIFWPFYKKRIGQGRGFATDGPVEQKVITPLLTVGVVIGSIYLFDWPALLPEY